MQAWLTLVQDGPEDNQSYERYSFQRDFLLSMKTSERVVLFRDLVAAGMEGELGLVAMLTADSTLVGNGAADGSANSKAASVEAEREIIVDPTIVDNKAAERLQKIAENKVRKFAARSAALRLLAAANCTNTMEVVQKVLLAPQEPWQIVVAALEATDTYLEQQNLQSSGDLLGHVLLRATRDQIECVQQKAIDIMLRLVRSVDVAEKIAGQVMKFEPGSMINAIEALASPELENHLLQYAFQEHVHKIAELLSTLPNEKISHLGKVLGRYMEDPIDMLERLEDASSSARDEESSTLAKTPEVNIFPYLLKGYLEAKPNVQVCIKLMQELQGLALCSGESRFPKTWRSWSINHRKDTTNATALALNGVRVGLTCLVQILQNPISTNLDETCFLSTLICAAAWDQRFMGFDIVPVKVAVDCFELGKKLQEALEEFHHTNLDAPDELWALLRSRLSGGKWHKNECLACSAMLRLVQRGSRKEVGGEIAVGHLVPMILPLVDHASIEVCVPGFAALHHLVNIWTTTEVRWYGDLLLDRVMLVCTSSRDLETLQLSLPTLMSILLHLELPNPLQRMNKHHNALEALLPCAELATEMDVLAAFSTLACDPLVQRLQLQSIYFMPQILEIVQRGIGTGHREARRSCLNLLRTMLTAASPRIAYHQQKIVALLARHKFVLQGPQKLPVDEEVAISQEILALVRKHGSAKLLEDDLSRLAKFVTFTVEDD